MRRSTVVLQNRSRNSARRVDMYRPRAMRKSEVLSYYKQHYRDRSGYETFLIEAEAEYPSDCLRIQFRGTIKDIFLSPFRILFE